MSFVKNLYRTYSISLIILSTQLWINFTSYYYTNVFSMESVLYINNRLLLFFLFQITLLEFLPGNKYCGPIPTDNRQITPVYKENGVKSFILTCLITQFCISIDVLNPLVIYFNVGIVWGLLNIYTLILCFYLLITIPSCFCDYFHNLNIIENFYIGQELYPIFHNLNIKFIINCRIGMMLWATLLIIYINSQYIMYRKSNPAMKVNFILQMIYIFKFFYCEKGYTNSLNIMHDKAGYYICWCYLVLVPSFYTLSSYHLVSYKGTNSENSKILLFTGLLGIILTYWIDYQKKLFRETNGKCKIFGKRPKYLNVFYLDNHDRHQTNKLLLSGFWCISKHFNYVTELIVAYSWCLCCSNSIHRYMYPIFLTGFLLHRAERDSERCNNKYFNWHRYCEIIKYKMIPGIY